MRLHCNNFMHILFWCMWYKNVFLYDIMAFQSKPGPLKMNFIEVSVCVKADYIGMFNFSWWVLIFGDYNSFVFKWGIKFHKTSSQILMCKKVISSARIQVTCHVKTMNSKFKVQSQITTLSTSNLTVLPNKKHQLSTAKFCAVRTGQNPGEAKATFLVLKCNALHKVLEDFFSPKSQGYSDLFTSKRRFFCLCSHSGGSVHKSACWGALCHACVIESM